MGLEAALHLKAKLDTLHLNQVPMALSVFNKEMTEGSAATQEQDSTRPIFPEG